MSADPNLTHRLRSAFLSSYNPRIAADAVFSAVIYDQRDVTAVREQWHGNRGLRLYLDVTGATFDDWWSAQAAAVQAWRNSEAERVAKAERSRLDLCGALERFDWRLLGWGVLNDVLAVARKALPRVGERDRTTTGSP